MKRVGDRERDLGVIGPRRLPVIAGDGHDLTFLQRDDRELIVVVDVREVVGLRGVLGGDDEETLVEALVRELVVEAEEGGALVRPDRAEVEGRAVLQRHVALVAVRVGRRRLRQPLPLFLLGRDPPDGAASHPSNDTARGPGRDSAAQVGRDGTLRRAVRRRTAAGGARTAVP